MPIPASYTEETLALFMDKTAAAVADVLDWSVAAGSYEEAVNNALLAYGTDDISEITGLENIKHLRALAKVELWRAVVNTTAADFDFQADGGRYSRSLIHKMAMENLQEALREAAPYDPAYRVVVDTLDYKHDPYRYRPEDETTL